MSPRASETRRTIAIHHRGNASGFWLCGVQGRRAANTVWVDHEVNCRNCLRVLRKDGRLPRAKR